MKKQDWEPHDILINKFHHTATAVSPQSYTIVTGMCQLSNVCMQVKASAVSLGRGSCGPDEMFG